MLDRRTFLKASLATSAIAAVPVAARAARPLAGIDGATVETLDRLCELHPGFAYFAGLPGHLGMPFAQRMQWAASPAAHTAFAELQKQCGVACVIIGSRAANDRASGLSAIVLRALGPKHSSPHHIVPYGTTIALVMPPATWNTLDDRTRAAVTAAAARMVRDAQHHPAPRYAAISSEIAKISEAVVASIANHDALTQRINASYFAYRKVDAALRPKNVV